MDKNFENDTIIYSDWMIVKEEIWTSWYGFLNYFSDMLTYQQKVKFSASTYSGLINNFIGVYTKIGLLRFKTYLTNQELTNLKKIYHKVLIGETLEIIEFDEVRGYIETFFNKSGMDELNNAKPRSPSEAIKDVFKNY